MQIRLIEYHTESEIALPVDTDPNKVSRVKLWAELPPLRRDISHIKQRSKGNIVFCLPIFEHAHRYPSQWHSLAQIGYMKRIFWLAYELLHFTDSQDTGTGVYIVCEDVIRPLLEPYRQLCNFPEELILTVPADALGYLKKIAFLNQLAKRTDFKYYMSLDLSITFYNHISICQELLDSWANSDVDTILQGKSDIWDQTTINFEKGVRVFYEPAAAHNKIPKERFYRDLPEFFGYNTYEDYLKHVLTPNLPLSGWFYGLSRKHILSPEFQELFDFATGNGNINYSRLTLDEAFLALYWHKYLSPDRRFIRIPENLWKDFCWNPCFIKQVDATRDLWHEDDEFYDFYLNRYRNLNR